MIYDNGSCVYRFSIVVATYGDDGGIVAVFDT